MAPVVVVLGQALLKKEGLDMPMLVDSTEHAR
jgi:hypothetical protein